MYNSVMKIKKEKDTKNKHVIEEMITERIAYL